MTFLKRLQSIANSSLNSLLDSMENPEKIIELWISEMKAQEKQAQKKLLEIKILKQQTHNNYDGNSALQINESERDLQQIILQISQHIEAAKKKQRELLKKLMRAKLAGKTQELKGISQTAKDYVHDTTTLDTYQRIFEKIEKAENLAQGLEEITNIADENKKVASQIENELASLKEKLKK
jgi:phage shock protein A